MANQRILIICNKSWETDAVLSAIFNDDLRHPSFDFKKIKYSNLIWPWTADQQGIAQPRVIFETDKYQFEIWCIQNIMAPNPKPSDTYYYSRSIQKGLDFHKITEFDKDKSIKTVVAFGTGGVPTEVSKNGNVVIGSNIFVYDASPELPNEEKYNRAQFGQLLFSSISEDFFNALNIGMSSLAMKLYFEKKALVPPINPAYSFQVIVDKSIVAISDVNVKSYSEYKTADKAALDAYAALKTPQVAYSVETTHGITKLEIMNTDFLFVTAVTDRDAYFDVEVTPRVSAQNFSCSFNGGLVISWLIPFMNGL